VVAESLKIVCGAASTRRRGESMRQPAQVECNISHKCMDGTAAPDVRLLGDLER
jgi:hypothetical protein